MYQPALHIMRKRVLQQVCEQRRRKCFIHIHFKNARLLNFDLYILRRIHLL